MPTKNVNVLLSKANALSANLLAAHKEFERELSIMEIMPTEAEKVKATQKLEELVDAWSAKED